MLKQKYEKLIGGPVGHAVLTFLVWFAGMNLLVLLVDKLWSTGFSLMFCFGFIYPVGTFILFFRIGRRHGGLWYFAAAVIAACVLEFLLYRTYRIIVPNMIVLTVLTLLFGCGIGSCFADKDALQKAKEQRRLKRMHEDENYVSILSSDISNKKK
ncbi:MAG: hypothetical protein IJ806_05495 [Ruminococcus sp.]|nr:hypothetical protein [Ruminococcus sp.]